MKRTELDCPHPACNAVHPFRTQQGESYTGLHWCRCGAEKVRVEVRDGEVKLERSTS